MQAIDKAQNKSGVKSPSLNALKSINKEIEKEMKKLGITEETITEAKELDPATVGKIASMTDKNDHNGSLLTLANAMKDKMGHLKKNKMKPTVKLIKLLVVS